MSGISKQLVFFLITFFIQGVLGLLPSGAILPLFIDPEDDCSGWSTVIGSAQEAGIVAFYIAVNPANGPGPHKQPKQKFQTCIAKLLSATAQNNNVKLLGYVDTRFGKRSSHQVFHDIDTYSGWNNAYRPIGIYFDNVPTDSDSVELYQTFADRVRHDFNSSSLVILNPSSLPSSGFFTFSDIIITINTFFDNFTISQIQNSTETPSRKQAVILHDGPLQLGLDWQIVDEISAIADVAASLITNASLSQEFNVSPSDFSTFCGLLIGSQTA